MYSNNDFSFFIGNFEQVITYLTTRLAVWNMFKLNNQDTGMQRHIYAGALLMVFSR